MDLKVLQVRKELPALQERMVLKGAPATASLVHKAIKALKVLEALQV